MISRALGLLYLFAGNVSGIGVSGRLLRSLAVSGLLACTAGKDSAGASTRTRRSVSARDVSRRARAVSSLDSDTARLSSPTFLAEREDQGPAKDPGTTDPKTSAPKDFLTSAMLGKLKLRGMRPVDCVELGFALRA